MYSKIIFIIFFLNTYCNAFIFLPNLKLITNNFVDKMHQISYNGGGGNNKNNNLISASNDDDDNNNMFYLLLILNICMIKLTYNNNNIFDLFSYMHRF